MSQAQHFDSLFAGSPDPWGYDWRWYEARKKALLLACLPKRRYSSGFEPGCANGALSDALAQRCESFLASDASERAAKLARERLRSSPWVRVETLTIPKDWPRTERFDLIVLSEFLYYLDESDLNGIADCVQGSLAEGATLLACNWKGAAPDRRMPTDQVHKRLAEIGLPSIVHHEEADFLLDVWTSDGRSVAQAEGLA